MHTRDGRPVEIVTRNKLGMAIFTVFGMMDGKPCHWTASGRYRMDDNDDPADVIGLSAKD